MSVEISLEKVSWKLGVVVRGHDLSTFKVEVKGQGFKVMFNYLNLRDAAFKKRKVQEPGIYTSYNLNI